MTNNRAKNPLKVACALLSVNSVVYVLLFIARLTKGFTFAETVARQKGAIVGLCLSILFIVCYLRRYIIAWWIAVFFCPIMFVLRAIIKNRPPDDRAIFAFAITIVFVAYYLGPKYKEYKDYLEPNCTNELY